MNGRNITSWGVNPEITSEGQVMRAPFETENRYAFRDDGDVYRHNGMEVRPFFFGAEKKEKSLSAATEGGCIEIKVFRSRGRRRRMPRAEEFCEQEKYGVL